MDARGAALALRASPLARARVHAALPVQRHASSTAGSTDDFSQDFVHLLIEHMFDGTIDA